MARKDTRKDAVGVKELIGDVDVLRVGAANARTTRSERASRTVFAVGKRRRTTKRDLVGEVDVLKVGRSRETQRRTIDAMERGSKRRRRNGRSFGEKVAAGVGGTVDKAEDSVINIFKETTKGTKRFVDDVEDELGRFF